MLEAFSQIDINGDNKIQEKEFINAFVKANPKIGRKTALTEAGRLFKLADSDKNGYISFKEWCAAGINLK